MPRIVDKIIINEGTTRAMWKAIKGLFNAIKREYKTLKKLAKEIQKAGLLNETDSFRDQMQKLCDEKLKADQQYILANHAYLDGLRSLEKDLAHFIDTHP